MASPENDDVPSLVRKCGEITRLIQQYYSAAESAYGSNPEPLSAMVLTIMELWVACDVIATRACPLLMDYATGFTRGLLDPLVLPKREQLKRLARVENYLDYRFSKAKADAPWEPPRGGNHGQDCSFAVQYLDDSVLVTTTQQQIEAQAEEQRAQKREEWKSASSEYRRLMDEYNNHSHQNEWRAGSNGSWSLVHTTPCLKCAALEAADALRVVPFEWPLPEDEVRAKAAVFELEVPEVFREWRSATLGILLDIFRARPGHGQGGKSLYFPNDDPVIYRVLGSARSDRFRLASTRSPIASEGKGIPPRDCNEENIIRKYQREYKLYDTSLKVTVAEPLKSLGLPQVNYSYAPSSVPQPLWDWITSTGHAMGSVMARQAECSGNMSLEEFRAFGNLRGVVSLQWHNILCQLAMPTLNLNRRDTLFLLLQAANQAGPRSEEDESRDAHSVLQDSVHQFSETFCGFLFDALSRIQANWEADGPLAILTCLGTRLLSMSLHHIQHECLRFLREVRATAIHRVRELIKKEQNPGSDKERQDLGQRAFIMALICHATFDLGPEHLRAALSRPLEAGAAEEMLESSIIIHQRLASRPKDDALSDLLYHRWIKLSHEALAPLGRLIVRRADPCLNAAIGRTWEKYEPGSGVSWKAVRGRRHLLEATSTPSPGRRMLLFRYNLLTGEFLVDNAPLGALPSSYSSHRTYKRLIEDKYLPVAPSTLLGLRFATRSPYRGFDVHFGMHKGELIVLAHRPGAEYWLIPPCMLRGDIPNRLASDYAHWLDIARLRIELRPLSDAWMPLEPEPLAVGSGAYIMTFDGNLADGVARLQGSDSQHLVDIRSRTAERVSTVFLPIERLGFLHLLLSPDQSSLSIELPRLNLRFTLRVGGKKIRSERPRGLFIDGDQSIGTLWNLRSKLVLRSVQREDGKSGQRVVIIPQNDIDITPGLIGGHAQTSIRTGDEFRVRYHMFKIDKRLGRLEDTGALASKLFLCHLHAVTTHCLPDKLTGRTGTEEALRILTSAAVRSSDGLDSDAISLLRRIASLSPRRKLSAYLQVSWPTTHTRTATSQAVTWSSLPSLAQDESFCQIVESALKRMGRGALFFPADKTAEPLKWSEPSLVRRQMARTAAFRAGHGGIGGGDGVAEDITYRARHVDFSSFGWLAYRMSRMFEGRRWGAAPSLVDANSHTALFDLMGHTQRTRPSHAQALQPEFDIAWLQPFSATLAHSWFEIQQRISRMDLEQDRYRLLLFFAALGGAKEANLGVVQILLSLCTAPALRAVQAPSTFVPEREPSKPAEQKLKHLACATAKGTLLGEGGSLTRSAIDGFVSELRSQWPCKVPVMPSRMEYAEHLDMVKLMAMVNKYFLLCYQRRESQEYLRGIKSGMETLAPLTPDPSETSLVQELDEREPSGEGSSSGHGTRYLAVADLFTVDAPSIDIPEPERFSDHTTVASAAEPQRSEIQPQMKALVDGLNQAADFPKAVEYVADLQRSLEYLRQSRSPAVAPQSRALNSGINTETLGPVLKSHLAACQLRVDSIFDKIKETLNRVPDSVIPPIVSATWFTSRPMVTRLLLLEQLSRKNWTGLSSAWRRCLVNFALSITHVQRADRLMRFAKRDRLADVLAEMANVGHTNWDPMEFPESLLFEAESGVMIRPVQEEIAAQMRAPPQIPSPSGRHSLNAVMQLNMGEGKSSVIVPIVAAALADGTRLVRILVGKAQSRQMMHILTKRLGGLLGRVVYTLPFSRDVKLDKTSAETIRKLCEECRSSGGVLLMQPEQVLSFQLLGLESVIASKDVGRSLLQTQSFFEDVSRDIIDESDDNLSVRFELTYMVGAQGLVEFAPYRWLLIQSVLDVVADLVGSFVRRYPDALVFYPSKYANGFPLLRILDENRGGQFLDHVAAYITRNLNTIVGFPSIPELSAKLRTALHHYITNPRLDSYEKGSFERNGLLGTDSWKAVLLLRGLFANRVLAFALRQKRWRVNFGLDAHHSPPTAMAVPYRAKDLPAPRSEFSHPDLRIILTCLSYYYGGLSDGQLVQLLEHIMASPSGVNDYARLTRSIPAIPQQFRSIGSVNLKDDTMCAQHIFPHLRYHKAAVDYFLAQILFRKEMRGFTQKLTASGWDIAKSKTYVTTGFSGTNDSKYLLPLTIGHLDLEGQRHTNASVLNCLLREENKVREVSPGELDGGGGAAGSPSEAFLRIITEGWPRIRVVLDVGAQILDLRNRELASRWLEMDPSAEAAIYVDENDELSTVTRAGHVEPLVSSPYATDMATCLVFLDEAHTRGIDLQLPDDYRAAVLLGPHLVKDTLMQACMRMRKLGRGQSVVFVVPPEVRQKICMSRSELYSDKEISTTDILKWSISQTWAECSNSIRLWAAQGIRFQQQEALWERAEERAGERGRISVQDAAEFLEEESQDLEARYRPHSDGRANLDDKVGDLAWERKEKELTLIQDRCADFGIADFDDASLHEEQERELMIELQEERLVTTVEDVKAEEPVLHPAVVTFVRTGRIAQDLCGFRPAFSTLKNTSLASFYDPDKWVAPRELLVTEDFARTVVPLHPGRDFKADQYQRPVQWVVTRYKAQGSLHSTLEHMVIFSPWEVGQLLADFANVGCVNLHLYAPRTSLSYKPLDSLRLYSVPRLPSSWDIPRRRALQLNLFAGSLYMRDFDDYVALCEFLGLPSRVGGDGHEAAGTPVRRTRPSLSRRPYGFITKPLAFIKAMFMTIRRDGRDISRTDIGSILAGRILHRNDLDNRVITEDDADDYYCGEEGKSELHWGERIQH